MHKLDIQGQLATLNRAALHYEKQGDLQNSLKAVFLLLEKVKQSNKEARAHHEGAADGGAEESKATGEFDKSI